MILTTLEDIDLITESKTELQVVTNRLAKSHGVEINNKKNKQY